MYFYYKNKYENKSKDNEYLPKNLNFTNFEKEAFQYPDDLFYLYTKSTD